MWNPAYAVTNEKGHQLTCADLIIPFEPGEKTVSVWDAKIPMPGRKLEEKTLRELFESDRYSLLARYIVDNGIADANEKCLCGVAPGIRQIEVSNAVLRERKSAVHIHYKEAKPE